MFKYSDGLLLTTTVGCVGSGAPTSQVYSSSTVIQMVTEYHILWPYAALQWHNVPTKNREYQ
jgi:hypothetical protein